MREIKFRAWDDGKMIYPYGALSNIGRFFRVIREDAIIMQYTGLNVKNGKEAYHKDFVRSGIRIYLIEWQVEEARFWLAPQNHSGSWKFMDELKSMEIIGNIYENPILLSE